MNAQTAGNSHKNVFDRPTIPRGLSALVSLVILTHICTLLMNQPAAYWLDPQYAATSLPLAFLLRAGPWLFLGFAALYLIICSLLLNRLSAAPALFLAVALTLFHSLALHRTSNCGFQQLYFARSADACFAYRYIPLVVIWTLFGLILTLEPRSESLARWSRRISTALAVAWIFLMVFGLYRAAFPLESPWKPLAPAHSPGPRSLSAIAYDTKRQRAVLFGGNTYWNGREWVYDNSTWEWDGQDWYEIETAVAPSGRICHAMAYDKQRGTVLLYGGQNATGILADLWEWDGVTWHRLCPVCNPAARIYHQMVYDTARQKILIYGGYDSENWYAEGWTWDGEAWAYLPFESSTPAFSNAPLVYDQAHDRLVTFIGDRWGGTFIEKADDWRESMKSPQPPLRGDSNLVYNPLNGRIVLFGGRNLDDLLFDDTWILDRETWTQLRTPSAPSPRGRAVAFFDPVRESIILYGGEQRGVTIGDMWELDLSGGKLP